MSQSGVKITYNRSSSFPNLVAHEVAQAKATYPPFNSLHEGYAVLWEEVEELWDEIKKKPTDRNWNKLKNECVQVAAMAQRLAEDCGLLEA